MTFFKRKPRPNKTVRNYKDRKWLGILFLVLAGLIGFVILPVLYSQQSETDSVIVAVGRIAKGQTIQDSQIALKEIGTYGLAKDYETKKEKVVNRIATMEMLPGDIITTQKIGEAGQDVVSDIVNEKKRLVTITIASNAAGVASHIRAGDTVTVYSILESEGGPSVVTNPSLQNLVIYDVENTNTDSVSDVKKDVSGGSDSVINTVTFIATEEQARALIAAEYSGKIHIIFVKR